MEENTTTETPKSLRGRKLPREWAAQAAREHFHEGATLYALADKFGVHYLTIVKWVAFYQDRQHLL